ncbi:nicotinamide riboside transporter PnuC [Colwellia sp. E2M01]|uniref:nicotinamide riboside transporter PnuC n=1 Tax=Colwellia sp. E2M01 TaxID=2841561 RepID=UPI001C09D9A3|nr:nicotinamide riboside transporter PnuC [Colwellia sp. E2M01]MBU2871727.1 nicotinamide riboside transporter PnuC [Colwellia sp. E2M01]
MSEIFNSVSTYFVQLPWLELMAMLLSLAYVILVAKGNIWCWPAAFISTAIYAVIFFDVKLLMDSALSVYYLLMAIYGYWQWSNPVTKNDDSDELPIISWSVSLHIKICLGLALISLLLGYLVSNFTSAHYPYLDTFTTVFAVFSTYLVTQKVLENWLYWIVIDLVSIYLYIEKGLIPTTVLFVIFVVIAFYGYIKWLKSYKKEQDCPEPTSLID